MRGGSRLAVLLTISVFLFGCLQVFPLGGRAEEIIIEVIVQNAEPEILGLHLRDEFSSERNSVPPSSEIYVDIDARDNNTIGDVASLELCLYSPNSAEHDADSVTDHLTFRWDINGFSSIEMPPYLLVSNCRTPSNWDAADGVWRFAIAIPDQAREADGWTALAIVRDESSESRSSISFEISSSPCEITIQSGLNLATWVGLSGNFADIIPDTAVQRGLFKIWRRNNDGTYSSAQYYESGTWWSSDDSFTGLLTGEGYFFESTDTLVLQPQRGTQPSVISLDEGVNMVGWIHPTCTLEAAFPQNPSDYAVFKVWRKLPDGSYSFAQYYPDEDIWWSSDPDFSVLEAGKAYFVEVLRAIEFNH